MRGKLQFIADGVSPEIVRRRSRFTVGSDQLSGVIFDGSNAGLFFWIPPLIRDDAVPVAVGSGEQRRMPRRRARVGVVVITVGEIRAMIQ